MHSHVCRNTVTEHKCNYKVLFDMWFKVPLLAHSCFFLLFGLFVHQNVSRFIQRWNKHNWNFGSTIYIGNFTFIWQFYHISDNCRFPVQLGPGHIGDEVTCLMCMCGRVIGSCKHTGKSWEVNNWDLMEADRPWVSKARKPSRVLWRKALKTAQALERLSTAHGWNQSI